MELKITNLSNSIRFYNLLFGHRPDRLSYGDAVYSNGDFVTELKEVRTLVSDDLQVVYLRVPDVKKVFNRMKTMIGHLPGRCQVLETTFQVLDPDGHRWVLSEEKLNESLNQEVPVTDRCYLLPANY